MRHLILLSAIPGSGKSTWANEYKRTHENTFIVASDEIRIRLTGDVQNFEHEDEVWATYLSDLNRYAEEYEDVNVIADATNLTNEYRLFYGKMTPKFDKHSLVVFNIPLDICLLQNRMRTRSRIVPEEAVKKMYTQFEKPNDEVMDLFDEVIFIGKSYHSDKVKTEK